MAVSLNMRQGWVYLIAAAVPSVVILSNNQANLRSSIMFLRRDRRGVDCSVRLSTFPGNLSSLEAVPLIFDCLSWNRQRLP